ncbi:MAG: zf-HC2 domain-containing protein [Endomicrobium sp.]|jgi:anti-sigma factor RsiW|nr:zf-HC2 domain-containing protein [Endomicrobium sp.]
MKCKDFVLKLSLYVDDKLPQNERILLEDHLKSCKECLNEYFLLKNLKSSLANLPAQKAGDNFESVIMQKIGDKFQETNFIPVFFQTIKVSLLTAVFLLGVIATFNFLTPDVSAKDSYDNIDALNKYVLKDASACDKIISDLMG